MGELEEAVACYRRVLTLKPDFAEAQNNLGAALSSLGKLDEAIARHRRALELKPDYAAAQNNLGTALSQLGNLEEAIACYRRALELKPDYALAQNNLGNAFRKRGKLEEAIACYRRALELRPAFVEAQISLGNAWSSLGNLKEAIAGYRRALELRPDSAEAQSNLGNALKDQGKLEEAIACHRRALELNPDSAEAQINLGAALSDLGKREEAIACYRRAVELKPDFAEAQNNLGNALRDQGNLEEAIACHRRALELKPDYAEAQNNLGVALSRIGRLEEAIAGYRRALELRPDFAWAQNNLGIALSSIGRLGEAIACYRRALELEPDFAVAQNNLGNAFKDQGKLVEAIVCYHRALELQPGFAEAENNLGNAFKDQGKLEEAIAGYRRALELRPDYPEAHSNLLCTLQYRTGVTLAALAVAHAEYDRQHAAPLRAPLVRHEKIRRSHRRPRIGFVSPDLGRHPVGFFLVRTLENLSQEQQETICYSDRIVKDGLTHRLQTAATRWRDVFAMSHEALAGQVREDGIDILFDLAGHTARNRLLVFARKPAPIQVSWIGYEGTTGLAVMDYLLVDRFMVPEGSERHYRETVLRMPDGYVCYDPPETAPPVGPPPALERGFATFGSFNNLAKITPEVVAVWAKILLRAPTTRLVIKYRGLEDSAVKERFLQLFAAHGVGPQRLDLLPASSYSDYLATYHQVDLTLDPFPFSGSTITCESLWMGVPVITCPGETFASRHSLSHLSNVGLTETIARDWEEYVELAVSLASDRPRLAALRSGLRERMSASPLCDGKRFATNLMSILHHVWEGGVPRLLNKGR